MSGQTSNRRTPRHPATSSPSVRITRNMCGIGGILSFEGRASQHECHLAIAQMIRLMARRGPDSQGSWVSPDKRLALAFTRLSILDLSAAGDQPMLSGDGRSAIVFNGEI